VECTADAPLLSYNETDPRISTVTEDKWCVGASGGQVECTQDPPGSCTRFEESDDFDTPDNLISPESCETNNWIGCNTASIYFGNFRARADRNLDPDVCLTQRTPRCSCCGNYGCFLGGVWAGHRYCQQTSQACYDTLDLFNHMIKKYSGLPAHTYLRVSGSAVVVNERNSKFRYAVHSDSPSDGINFYFDQQLVHVVNPYRAVLWGEGSTSHQCGQYNSDPEYLVDFNFTVLHFKSDVTVGVWSEFADSSSSPMTLGLKSITVETIC